MNKSMNEEELEKTYDAVAQAIDTAGEKKEALFLGKLCLTLAYKLADLQQVEDAIAAALQDLS